MFGLQETHRCPLSAHTLVQAFSHQPTLLGHHGCILQATVLYIQCSPVWVSGHMSSGQMHKMSSGFLKSLSMRLDVRNTISLAKGRDTIIFIEISKN